MSNKSDEINDYLPSVLNPRALKKQVNRGDLTLSQTSGISRCSLSLKRKNAISAEVKKGLQEIFQTTKENVQNNNTAPKSVFKKKCIIEERRKVIDCTVREFNFESKKENCPNYLNLISTKNLPKNKSIRQSLFSHSCEECSVGCSAIQDLETLVINNDSSPFSFDDGEMPHINQVLELKSNESLITLSSATELCEKTRVNSVSTDITEETVTYDITEEQLFKVSFRITNCETVDVSTKNINIKKIVVSHKDNTTNVDCEVTESSQMSFESETDENMNGILPIPPKRSAVAVNLEIKKKKLSEDAIENSKVLILNTDDIRKLSHVLVQPPTYKLVKRQILERSKFISSGKSKSVGASVKNGKTVRGGNLKQKRIDAYLFKTTDSLRVSEKTFAGHSVGGPEDVVCNDGEDMSKNLGVADAVKCDHLGKASLRNRRENDLSPRSIRLVAKREDYPRRQSIRVSSSDAPRVPSRGRYDSGGSSHSPRKSFNVESVQFSLPSKSKAIKTNNNSLSPRNIPHYKIVAGTHFAVDAFSYGEIPNVKYYFLTHFHSDHYSGLKKSFSKFLFCSKITADLCVSRLGVSPKCIHIINFDETITVDGVEVTAVDANHCPGAIMLVFTLPNGKTLLHTGDFRASPFMESYPVFWNKDIHTIYLDTTYCNPRYDFPTQEQSLEMALFLLRQKKLLLEKAGKKFSSVLIVCGTYTIGKEKFFLGVARRVGCSVWACPEKDRVLQAVEGRSFSHAPARACQLHVVPMRDLTHETLRKYLESLQGAFSEVVAFKPSGWENGKNPAIEKDCVTIHGIPYSEHSSFSELVRIVKFLTPKQVVPTVDISGGAKAVQKHFPCPLVCKEDIHSQSKLTDYYSIQGRQQGAAVT